MTLTAQEIADFRADIGDEGYIDPDTSETVYTFTNDELNRLSDRASGNALDARILAYRQLLANAVKFTNYTAGQTSESREAIFKHLQSMLGIYEAQRRGQVGIVGLRRKPPRDVDAPANHTRRLRKTRYSSGE